jgi:uncharacterized integral membrane protein
LEDHAAFLCAPLALHAGCLRGFSLLFEQCSRYQYESFFGKRLIMRYLIWFLRIVLFFLLLGFAVRNIEPVTLYYYFGYEWTAPLVLVILFFFALGVMLGAAACLGVVFRQRRQLTSYRRKHDVSDDHL